ncbi:MAG: PD-(D/E)XK nuclease family protein, partial [Mailhella sp.]
MKDLFFALAPLPGALPASFSRMNLLLSICPRQWKYRYELRLKGATPPADPAMEAGKAMHSVLEAAVNTSRMHGFAPGMAGYSWLMERRMRAEREPVRAILADMQGSAKKVLDAVIRTARKYEAKAFTERRLMLTRGGEVAAPREKFSNAGWVGFVDLELLGKTKMI